MNIVINTSTQLNDPGKAQRNFIIECFLKIAGAHREHSFFFITDGIIDKEFVVNDATLMAIAPKSKNILWWKIWYAYKLPSVLKKYKAALFINADTISVFKTTIPQCILATGYIGPQQSSLHKKNTAAFLNKAAMVLTLSQFVKNDLIRTFKTAEQKIVTVYAAAKENYLPAGDNERENTREKYTTGKEYFLFSGEINPEDNLINLLKAFSFFKKRQKSNMQLIITTNKILPGNAFIKSLQSYKYKDDVKLLAGLEETELATITASAYAFVYTTQQNDFYVPVLQAMQCGVPVIVSNTIIMKEICGDAALFTDGADFENMADKMMLLFKDENKRNEFIAKGNQQAAKFSLTETYRLLWQNIVKCAGATL